MTEPRTCSYGRSKGGADAPIALCLHGFPDTAQAALGYYRAAFSAGKPPGRCTELQRHWIKPELVRPTWYLHRADDGCMTVKLADRVPAVLPEGSDFAVIEHAGHFLQLEQPEAVANRILDFLSVDLALLQRRMAAGQDGKQQSARQVLIRRSADPVEHTGHDHRLA
jgi:hypothetical protein